MRRGGGIAHQHDIAVRPLFAKDSWKIQPSRAANVRRIRNQRMAAEIFCKNPFAGPAGFVLADRAEAEVLPRRLRALDDECRRIGVKLVSVCPDPALLGLLEDKREGVVEFLMGAE